MSTQPGALKSLPSCIPPPTMADPGGNSPRTLVLCFDGTGDQFDADNSNVVQLFSMLKKDDRRQQMVYYQAGIGTYTSPHFATPFMAKFSKTLDAMIAWNLDAHVMSGYEFLMQNYEAGDKICIFGFSRGAYTARALAGMIHKVGLLPTCNHQQVPFAYKMYTRTSAQGWAQSTAFKKAFSINVDVDFLGVWDTVSSVGGFPMPKRLPFTSSNTSVKVFRHAVSLDERRAKFKANLYNHPTAEEKTLGVQAGEMPKAGSDGPVLAQSEKSGGARGVPEHDGKVKTRAAKILNKAKQIQRDLDELSRDISDGEDDPEWQSEMERRFSRMQPQEPLETDVLEVWFAGCHCDVGGGSVPNDTTHNLARIPLRWMIRQCFLTDTGIRFHSEPLKKIGMDPDSLYPVVKARPEALYAPVFRSLDDPEKPDALQEAPQDSKQAKGKDKTLRMATLKFSSFRLTLPRSWIPTQVGTPAKLRKRARSAPEVTLAASNSGPGPGEISVSVSGSVYPIDNPQIAMQPKALTEEEEDLADALTPIYDQLNLNKAWWPLEIIPMRHRVQREDDSWGSEVSMNLGKGRQIPRQHKEGVNVHRSVQVRMEAHASLILGSCGKKYSPRAKFEVEPTWVD